MFTGIITNKGVVASVVQNKGGDLRLGIKTSFDLNTVDIGASIACSGCCLTVVEKQGDVFFVDVSSESISKTTIGKWVEGNVINLEQALKMGDELGGHIVSGHIDGLTKLVRLTQEGESWRLVFSVPNNMAQFVAYKGSVSLNGVSLTVNEVSDLGGTTFGVNIIRHTWDNTNLGALKVGDDLHIEIDMLARYVARIADINKA